MFFVILLYAFKVFRCRSVRRVLHWNPAEHSIPIHRSVWRHRSIVMRLSRIWTSSCAKSRSANSWILRRHQLQLQMHCPPSVRPIRSKYRRHNSRKHHSSWTTKTDGWTAALQLGRPMHRPYSAAAITMAVRHNTKLRAPVRQNAWFITIQSIFQFKLTFSIWFHFYLIDRHSNCIIQQLSSANGLQRQRWQHAIHEWQQWHGRQNNWLW